MVVNDECRRHEVSRCEADRTHGEYTDSPLADRDPLLLFKFHKSCIHDRALWRGLTAFCGEIKPKAVV